MTTPLTPTEVATVRGLEELHSLTHHVLITGEETGHAIWDYATHTSQQVAIVTYNSCSEKMNLRSGNDVLS